MKMVLHPLVFLGFYVLWQALNSLASCLNGYDRAEITAWNWIEWMQKVWISVGIASVGAIISFCDQKLARWHEEQSRGGPTLRVPKQPHPATDEKTDMKKLAAVSGVLLVSIVTILLSGCAFFKASADKQLATYKSIVTEATYIGASIDLAQTPEHRPAYVAVQQALAGLQGSYDYDPQKLMDALRQLPIKEFKGNTGAFYVQETLFAWNLITGLFIDQGSTPAWVRASLEGAKSGLDRALLASPAQLKQVEANTVIVSPPKTSTIYTP